MHSQGCATVTAARLQTLKQKPCCTPSMLTPTVPTPRTAVLPAFSEAGVCLIQQDVRFHSKYFTEELRRIFIEDTDSETEDFEGFTQSDLNANSNPQVKVISTTRNRGLKWFFVLFLNCIPACVGRHFTNEKVARFLT